MEDENIKLTVYDQKAYLQLRLHQKLIRIDCFNANPLAYNLEMGCFNYQIIFNDLCSIFLDISSKLSETEAGEIIELKKKIQKKMFLPINYRNRNNMFSVRKTFDFKLWSEINEGLFNLRLKIEEAMTKHGFNPDKEDLGSIVGKM